VKAVLDASAVLAYCQGEPGSEQVESVLAGSCISAVNWAEVAQKCIARGTPVDGVKLDREALGLTSVAFTAPQAESSARIWITTRVYGLSLGDRACLSLGLDLGIPILTTDAAWGRFNLPVDIRVLRG
jgi:ribonuclease VapC